MAVRQRLAGLPESQGLQLVVARARDGASEVITVPSIARQQQVELHWAASCPAEKPRLLCILCDQQGQVSSPAVCGVLHAASGTECTALRLA